MASDVEKAREALDEYRQSRPNDYERAYADPLARALRALLAAHHPTEPGERTQEERAEAARELRDVGREVEPADNVREALIDALFSSDLIEGYDWLGTGSSYPGEESMRREVGQVADVILGRFTVAPRAGRESARRVLEGAPGRVRFLYTIASAAAPGCAVIQLESVPVEIAATSPEEAIEIAQRARPLPEFLVYKVFRVTNTIDREGTPWTS